ncbi:MAG TPA: protocatechuate 3,4-dioxygenase subunit alpha [Solirubrobacteraceae bacterium]|nr:protocatechuate 3,4-dioxygenase subunit alpha [Solirubrobacteraceae bacterium]
MPESTPPQTVGPFFAIGLPWDDGPEVVAPGSGGAIALRGTVFDGEGDPVQDALVETWQAPGEGCRGFGRCPTDAGGRWEIVTRKPAVADGEAPHVAVAVFARGLLDRVPTRIYFADEAEANAADPLLSGLERERRETLIAAAEDGGYRFDIHLQGDRETVFFRF